MNAPSMERILWGSRLGFWITRSNGKTVPEGLNPSCDKLNGPSVKACVLDCLVEAEGVTYARQKGPAGQREQTAARHGWHFYLHLKYIQDAGCRIRKRLKRKSL
jgi:hypothetical protein